MAIPSDLASDPVSLVDLVDRVLASGIVISGDLLLSVADVDLIFVGLRLVITDAGERPVYRGDLLASGPVA